MSTASIPLIHRARPPERIVEWIDPDVRIRKPGLAFGLPLMAGRTVEGLWWRGEAVNLRRDEFTASRRALGQSIESAVLNATSRGDVLCVYIEADDPLDSQRRFAASTSAYDVWFKQQLASTSANIDFNQPLRSVTEIWEWHQPSP